MWSKTPVSRIRYASHKLVMFKEIVLGRQLLEIKTRPLSWVAPSRSTYSAMCKFRRHLYLFDSGWYRCRTEPEVEQDQVSIILSLAQLDSRISSRFLSGGRPVIFESLLCNLVY